MSDSRLRPRLEEALRGPVYHGGRYKPFGELTADDARGRAGELKEAGSWGPMHRVVPVARAWSELASLMDDREAAAVSELDPETVVSYAEKLWVLPPEDGLI
jgi:hypothetical protein